MRFPRGYERKRRVPSPEDLAEIEAFRTFLRDWAENRRAVLASPEGQKYLNITPTEAWLMQKAELAKRKAKETK